VRASHRSKGIRVPARAREYSRAWQRAAREQAAAWVPARAREQAAACTPTSATRVTRGRTGCNTTDYALIAAGQNFISRNEAHKFDPDKPLSG
jgi:hypothetical protein